VGNGLDLAVTIPGNTTAEISVPAAPGDDITVSGSGRTHQLRRDDQRAVFAAGSGDLAFEVRH